MHGFGFFSRIDELKEKGKELEKSNMVEPDNQLTEEQENELNNVAVIKLDDGDYKASGSAGNKPTIDEEGVEPQLGGMGLGTTCGIKKELTRTEAFQGAEIVDDESCDAANEIADSNKVEKIGPSVKVDEMFGEMFGKNFKAEDNSHDSSKPHVDIDIDVDGFKVKKGW